MLNRVAVEKLLPAKFAKIKSRQEAPQSIFSVITAETANQAAKYQPHKMIAVPKSVPRAHLQKEYQPLDESRSVPSDLRRLQDACEHDSSRSERSYRSNGRAAFVPPRARALRSRCCRKGVCVWAPHRRCVQGNCLRTSDQDRSPPSERTRLPEHELWRRRETSRGWRGSTQLGECAHRILRASHKPLLRPGTRTIAGCPAAKEEGHFYMSDCTSTCLLA